MLPIDDRTGERLNPDLVGRPQLVTGDTQIFYTGMTGLSENSVLSIKNKSFSVTAEVVVPDDGADGTLIAQGGAIGGWSLYAKDGRVKFAYNLLGIQTFTTEASRPLPPGEYQVRVEFAYDGGGFAKGGDVSLYYDGDQVGEGRVDATQPLFFSADEGLDIGRETGTAVAAECDVQEQWVHRRDQLGGAEAGRGRAQPPDRRGGARAGDDGPAVTPGLVPVGQRAVAAALVLRSVRA